MHTVKSSFEDFRNGKWVHYSKLPQLTINANQFHQDPAGYYLFPESFETMGDWHRFPYRLTVRVKPEMKVLDIGKLSFQDIQDLIEKLGFNDLLNDEYLNANRSDHDNRNRFWDIIRMRFMGEPGRFNKTFRRLGYDAIFDDDKVIHNAETQLLVLNPRMATVETIDEQKATGYDEIVRVLDLLSKKFGSVGRVQVKKPTQRKEWGDKLLTGELEITDGDKWVSFKVTPWFVDKKDTVPESISVRITDSKGGNRERTQSVTLRYRNFDNEIHKLTNSQEDVMRRMEAVFGKNATSSIVPIVQPDFLLPDHETDFPFTTLEQTGPLITYDAQPMEGDPETYLQAPSVEMRSFFNDFAPIVAAAAGEPHVTISEDGIEAEIEGKGKASGQVMGDYEWWFSEGEGHDDAEMDLAEEMPWNQIAILEHVEVEPQYRREGIGSKLVKAWIKGAKKSGAEAIFINASPFGHENRSTVGQLISFYKSLGFKTWKDYGENQTMFMELKKKARSEAEDYKPFATKDLKNGIELRCFGNPKGPEEFKIEAIDKATGNRVGSIDPKTPAYMAGWLGKDWKKHIAIPNAYVKHEYQRKGIGTAMYDWAEELSGAEAVPWEYADGGEEPMSESGKAFWRKRGFEIDDEVEAITAKTPAMQADKMFKAWYAMYGQDEGLKVSLGMDPRGEEKIDKKVARRWFDMRMKRVKRKLDQAGFRQGVIAYRCMTVTDMWKDSVKLGKLRATGGHWTLDRELAPNLCGGHGGKRNRERNAILEAYIPFTEFDTLDAFNPSWAEEWEEFEISPQTYVMMMKIWNGDFTEVIYEYPMPTKVSVYAPNYVASKVYETMPGELLKRHLMDTLHEEEFDSTDAQEEMADELISEYPEWELRKIPISKLKGYTAPFAKADQDIQRKVKEYLELSAETMPAIVAVPDGTKFYVRDGKHRLMTARKLGLKEMMVWIPVGSFDKAKKATSELRALAKATIPEDSELMEFYNMADADAWGEEVRKDASDEWDRMPVEERLREIPSVISHTGWRELSRNPQTPEEWQEIKDAWLGMRESWAMDDNNNTSETFFNNAKIVLNPTLVRFTDYPDEVFSHGHGPNDLGLTTDRHGGGGGDLAFAFNIKELKTRDDWKGAQSKYGEHIFKFKVPYAVEADHISDYERQTVFDVNTVQDVKKVDLPPATPKQRIDEWVEKIEHMGVEEYNEEVRKADANRKTPKRVLKALDDRYKSLKKFERAMKKFQKKKKTASADAVEAAGPNLSIKKFLDVIPFRDSFYDLYPGYSKPAKELDGWEEYKFDDKGSAIQEAREMIEMFQMMPDPIPVYRCISVKKEEDIDLDCPGTSWSWEKKSAISFAQNHGLSKPLALLTGKVRKKDVDWYATISLYYVYSGGSLGDSENEIRVDRSCGTVQDIKWEWVDKKKPKRAAAEVALGKSEEIEMFIGSAGMYYYSYNNLMDEKSDSMWEEQERFNKDEGVEETREEWAKSQEEFHETSGDPSMTFGDAHRVQPSEWLIHFTDANPYDILKDGFRGRDLMIIGLTTYYKAEAYEGNLALAYRLSDIPPGGYYGRNQFGKYGKNAVIFKAKDAARAWHNGDEENQTVFDVRGVKSMYPVFGDTDSLTLHSPKKDEPITKVERNNEGLEQIIDRLNRKDLKPDESVAESMAVAAPKKKLKKKPNIDFTSYGEGDDIPEEFVKLIPKTDALRDYINDPNKPVMLKLTVTVDGKPMGVGTLEDPSIHGLHLGDTTVVQVFLSPKARGIGIGTQLMEWLQEAKDTEHWAGYTHHSPGFKHLAEQYGVRDMDDAGMYAEDDPKWQSDGSYDDSYEEDVA